MDALNELFAKVAPSLNAAPGDLESVDGRIRVKSNPGKGMSWKEACARLGTQPIEIAGKNLGRDETLMSSGVGGAMMADVSVDTETGIVKMN